MSYAGFFMSHIDRTELSISHSRLYKLNMIVWRLASSRNPLPRNMARIVFHVELPRGTPRLRMPHPFMVICNENTVIGENCTFYHNVTIGSRQFGIATGAPTIGDEVIIYPGACIVGRITIGSWSIIGAGSVVLEDVPPGTVVAGNPAKPIGDIG